MKFHALPILMLLSVLAATVSTTQAASYVTSFDEYLGARTLSGQTGGTATAWDTNNISPGTDGIFDTIDDLGQSDYVGIVLGYSGSGSDKWGLMGGLTPVTPVVQTSYLWKPLDPTGALTVDFSVRFVITSSPSPRSARDTFGWTFRDASKAQILRVAFIPNSTATGLAIRVYNAANQELPGSGTQAIVSNSKYDLHVAISETNLVTVSIGDALGNAPLRIVANQPLLSNAPNGAAASSLYQVAATWTLATSDLSNYGYNSLLFNSYAVFFSTSTLSTTFANWQTQTFAGNPGADSTPGGNPDSDGLVNLLEYASLSNPLAGDGQLISVHPAAEEDPARIEFLWNSHASDLNYQLLAGTDVAGAATIPFAIESQSIEGDRWRIVLRASTAKGSRYFFRLRVNQTPP